MQTVVDGKDVLIRGKKDGDMVPFVCATGLEFYYDTELIEKATVGQAGFKGFTYGLGEWGFTLTGVSVVVPSAAALTVFDTILESLRKNGLDIEAIYTDLDGNLVTITGHCMIPHTGISSPASGLSEDTIELKGDGSFAMNATIISPTPGIPPDVQTINYTSAAGGETSLTYPATINKKILFVARDGTGKEVISVGTPNDKQVKWISSTGEFVLPYELGIGEWFYAEYV